MDESDTKSESSSSSSDSDEFLSLLHGDDGGKIMAKCRVSSVLNKDSRQFGSKLMFDDSDETCWNSDQGTPQYIKFDFERLVDVNKIEIMFQGGFVGQEGLIDSKQEESDEWNRIRIIDPEDNNDLQISFIIYIYIHIYKYLS